MALIACPECQKPVSTEAKSCPVCGYPIAEKLGAQAAQTRTSELLAEVRPSWWGYFWYWVFCWLIVPPFIAWIRRSSVIMRVYSDRIAIERGIFSKCYQDYNPHDIRSIDVDQSFLQRMVNIGDITISTSATVEASEEIRSIPDPRGLRDLILAQRGPR